MKATLLLVLASLVLIYTLIVSKTMQEAFFIAFLYWLPMVAGDNGGGVARLLRLPGSKTPLLPKYLGTNKTLWAYPMGALLSVGAMKLEAWFYYYGSDTYAWIFGICIGLGAVLGDHVKSYFKRKKGIKPGDPWVPYDQIDYVLGGWFVLMMLQAVYFNIRLGFYGMLVLAIQILFAITTKPLGNYLFYLLGLRKVPH